MQGSTVPNAVHVQINSAQPGKPFSFDAEVELNAETLDPNNMPLNLTGVFIKLPPDNPIEARLRSDRTDGGCSHKLFFPGVTTGYRFTMTPGTTLTFEAVSLHVNPVTDLPGLGALSPLG